MSALEENVLHERQEKYLAWLTTPPGEREPSSKHKYAADNAVALTTLRRWEKLEVFRREWQRRVDQLVGSPERQQGLLDRMWDQAMAGDVKAADLYFRVTGKMAPQPVTVTSERRIADLSDSELDELLSKVAVGEVRRRAEAPTVN